MTPRISLSGGDPIAPELCRTLERCRICGSTNLQAVVSLGDQYIASLFPTGPLPNELDQRFPLDVVRCADPQGCGLVQLRHTVAPGVLYDHYGYRSGTNEIMRANLAGIAADVEAIVDLRPGDVVLDIGCNDGTLLSSYAARGIERVGIDPSDAVKAIDSSDIMVINDFFSFDVYDHALPGRKAKAVTTIAMFYDLDEPGSFVAEIAKVLDDDGVWIIELSYLPLMLAATAFDTICHEHLEYYSLRPIEWMLGIRGAPAPSRGNQRRQRRKHPAVRSQEPSTRAGRCCERSRCSAQEANRHSRSIPMPPTISSGNRVTG